MSRNLPCYRGQRCRCSKQHLSIGTVQLITPFPTARSVAVLLVFSCSKAAEPVGGPFKRKREKWTSMSDSAQVSIPIAVLRSEFFPKTKDIYIYMHII